jgi:hypothetical protein
MSEIFDILELYMNLYKCKKALRLRAFLLPKPKPMRRFTLLMKY